MLRFVAAVLGIVFLAAAALLAQLSQPVSSRPVSPLAPIRFRNVAASAGVDFVLENNPTAEKHLIETMPGGIAVFDYDGDGLPDIFFTNGARVPALEKNAPKFHNRLFRNLGGMKFKDVTLEAGLAGVGYSIGAAAADYDNDGHVDLFVAGVRSNHLYRNLGKGKFADVTAKAGISSAVWSITGGWFDYDNDGLLDLFVVNYVKWSPEIAPFCGDPVRKLRAYCHPRFFDGLANTLYHNRGDGTFEDVSEKSGIASQIGKGMSVAFADYDGDGLTDAYVTNDKLPNFLFHNLGNGKFAEVALEAGAALPDSGRNISGMGVDFRDGGEEDLVWNGGHDVSGLELEGRLCVHRDLDPGEDLAVGLDAIAGGLDGVGRGLRRLRGRGGASAENELEKEGSALASVSGERLLHLRISSGRDRAVRL